MHLSIGKRILFTLLLLPLWAAAQINHPVMVNVQLNPPYSLYLSDYAAPDVQRMQVHILLKDLTESNYKCRLRVTIEGIGITIQNRTGFYVTPFLINGGEMVTLSGADLAPYFDPRNLVVQGLDNSFTKNGAKLPEGIYRFTVEVIDYNRNTVISNAGSAMVASFLSYPPIINLPMANAKVDAMDPQNVLFQWMPRHTASVNAAFNVVYKFRLVELVPQDRDPNDAMRSLRPIYENIVQQTSLVYGPGEPALTPGNNYAVQVQAIEADGKDMFINDGFSEVVKFTYGEKCSVPQQIVAAFAGRNELKISWVATVSQQGFTVRYREAGNQPSQWYEETSYTPQVTISGLKPGRQYEYQVKAQCMWGYGDYSAIQSFSMPNETLSEGDFVCGKNAGDQKITNTNNIEQLSIQDTIFAADFKVILTTVSGSNGRFSGTGQVMVPLLGFLDLPVTFSNIRVNTDKRMYAGVIELAQSSHAEVKQNLDNAINNLFSKLDTMLASGDPKQLFLIDAAEMMSEIDKMKGWDDLDQATKDQLGELQEKLKELQTYQAQYPDMSPQEQQSVGQKLGSDLKKLAADAKTAFEMAKQKLKDLLNIYKLALDVLVKDRAQLDSSGYHQKKVAFEQYLKAVNPVAQVKTTSSDSTVVLLQQVEELPAESLDLSTVAAIKDYLDALYQKNESTLIRILHDNKDESTDKEVIKQLKVDGKPATDVIASDAVKTDKDGTVKKVSVSILSLIAEILEKY
ncbi:Fibronectin type III domain-containing protein [Chitinophaga jiangningensis]|uniref:Fibronectin type III domain-containing protein n=1 Tax=Chitinophaga jiangningensis TaxID=1419482 RepID=A0A1M6YBN3_9BACT|nr:fibronectin type III domain-containing protein [Chitinophaga jiangningensis]SHL15552.1 Fibronectin type III domain-containing protein [Chitinophaga jiangningensis]